MIQKHKCVMPLVPKAARWQQPQKQDSEVIVKKLWWKKMKNEYLGGLRAHVMFTYLVFKKYVHCQLEFRLYVHVWPLKSRCIVNQSFRDPALWVKWLSWLFLWLALWPCYPGGPDLRHTFGFIVLCMLYKEIYI